MQKFDENGVAFTIYKFLKHCEENVSIFNVLENYLVELSTLNFYFGRNYLYLKKLSLSIFYFLKTSKCNNGLSHSSVGISVVNINKKL